MQARQATDSLVKHAVLSEFPGVRKAAAVELRERPWFAYVPVLLGSLQVPAELSYYVTTLTDGAHYGFTIEREGPTAYFAWSHGHRSYRTHTTSLVHDGEVVATSTIGLPDPIATVRGSHQMRALRRRVNDANAEMVSLNECIYAVLEVATGKGFERNPQAWWEWWLQYNELQVERNQIAQHRQTASTSVSQEYSQVSTTSSAQEKRLGFTPRPGRPNPPPPQYYVPVTGRPFTTPPNTNSCFLPGTRVSTNTGLLSIEKVRRGDYVLSQDPDTGELAYRPVLATTVRPPSPTLRIGVGQEEIAATARTPPVGRRRGLGDGQGVEGGRSPARGTRRSDDRLHRARHRVGGLQPGRRRLSHLLRTASTAFWPTTTWPASQPERSCRGSWLSDGVQLFLDAIQGRRTWPVHRTMM